MYAGNFLFNTNFYCILLVHSGREVDLYLNPHDGTACLENSKKYPSNVMKEDSFTENYFVA